MLNLSEAPTRTGRSAAINIILWFQFIRYRLNNTTRRQNKVGLKNTWRGLVFIEHSRRTCQRRTERMEVAVTSVGFRRAGVWGARSNRLYFGFPSPVGRNDLLALPPKSFLATRPKSIFVLSSVSKPALNYKCVFCILVAAARARIAHRRRRTNTNTYAPLGPGRPRFKSIWDLGRPHMKYAWPCEGELA